MSGQATLVDVYDRAAHACAKDVMTAYSTSFGLASRLFPAEIRRSIYDIYGLVRIADEIVDTYDGADRLTQLDALEAETTAALHRRYSTNPIVHAFQLTALRYDIDNTLIRPFFESMRLDAIPDSYQPSQYESYIHGSAEVIGLMCLKIFVDGDRNDYASLAPGAAALGAAFQKVNFLRDLAADHDQLTRYYFPIGSYETFDDVTKKAIVDDIKNDFIKAKTAIDQLPKPAKLAVRTAYDYYRELLSLIETQSAADLKRSRPRISDARKLYLLARSRARA